MKSSTVKITEASASHPNDCVCNDSVKPICASMCHNNILTGQLIMLQGE